MLLSISASVFYPRFAFLLHRASASPLFISLLASPISFFTGTPLLLVSFFVLLRLFSYLACCVIFFFARSFSEFVLPGLCFRIILFFSLSLSAVWKMGNFSVISFLMVSILRFFSFLPVDIYILFSNFFGNYFLSLFNTLS